MIQFTLTLLLCEADPALFGSGLPLYSRAPCWSYSAPPCLDLERDSPDRKIICTLRSFGRAVEGFDKLAEALTAYVSRAAEKMRRQGLATPAVIVMLNTNRHRPEDAQ
ncbi:hypothetical protein FV232_05505 [Methylobacterium sp. WL30]|uniref:DinB/UmuC family translesion DNA polymerase n=1 Tax=unclassified Methylobacterium TaxID=2615210 RepID=UPI0011CA2C27|nr:MULTISPECIES: hypothetical protein [unclassified Methylobacterium]TXN40619.1 hypothetical protein FV225_05660 [Methylobacterium sp. WL93]TXN51557.1 hypothetical protein FV227_07175 [Methylobacterium sp. WL119]TXN69529.1 hypothetical protein FV232_05505 [Methylobacterium sp. WL30]